MLADSRAASSRRSRSEGRTHNQRAAQSARMQGVLTPQRFCSPAAAPCCQLSSVRQGASLCRLRSSALRPRPQAAPWGHSTRCAAAMLEAPAAAEIALADDAGEVSVTPPPLRSAKKRSRRFREMDSKVPAKTTSLGAHVIPISVLLFATSLGQQRSLDSLCCSLVRLPGKANSTQRHALHADVRSAGGGALHHPGDSVRQLHGDGGVPRAAEHRPEVHRPAAARDSQPAARHRQGAARGRPLLGVELLFVYCALTQFSVLVMGPPQRAGRLGRYAPLL